MRGPALMMRSDAVMEAPGLTPPNRPTCILLERHGTWAAALRRVVDSPSYELRETRGFAEVHEALSPNSPGLVAIELRSESFQQAIEGIDRLLRAFPRTHCVVLGNRVPATIALLAWEAGAIAVINSPRQVKRVAEIVQQWAATVRAHPEQHRENEGIVKSVSSRLPFRAVDPARPIPKSSRSKPPVDEDDEPIEFEPLP